MPTCAGRQSAKRAARQSSSGDRAREKRIHHRDTHPPSGRDFRRRRRAIERVEAHLEVARKSTERPRAEDFLCDDFFRGHRGRRFEVWGLEPRRRRRDEETIESTIADGGGTRR